MTLVTRRLILDLTAVALLLAVAVVGFGPTFDGPAHLVAGFGAIVLGLGIAWLCAWRRWGILPAAGLTVAAYFLFGGALALPQTTVLGVIPTLDTWNQLAVGAIQSWKRLLTTVAPVAPYDGHLIVPFLLTLVAAVLTASLALRLRQAAWSLIPVTAFLTGQILLGMTEPAVPIVQGVVFAVVAAVWLALRQAWDPNNAAVRIEPTDVSDAQTVRHSRIRRLVSGAAVVAIAVGAGVATAAFASTPTTRYVLRDIVIPPFDVQQYASPLQSFRGLVRDDADTELFTVSGLPEDGRIRLATMDAYNGIVYNVSNDGAGSSSSFTPLRSNMSPDAVGSPAELDITIGDLGGVWLPDAGAVRSIEFTGDRADELRRTAHYNDATGTAAVTAGLTPGVTYTVDAVMPTVPSDAALADAEFAPIKMPRQDGIPDGLSQVATDAVGDADTPIKQARALQTWLSTDGYFSHGLEDDPYSPSGHGAARITSFFGGDEIIGDDEQYAAAMALLSAQLGIPARVVMGWRPDEGAPSGDFVATGDNVHAWVEIAFDGFGWVPFDPTPDEDNEPNEQTTTPRANPKPQVLQPPPPAQEPAELPPAIANDRDQEDEEEAGFDWIGAILAPVGIGLGVLIVLFAPFVIMGAVKTARRTQRRNAARPADRISGGWDELVDRAVDLNAPVTAGATRTESAAIVGTAMAQPEVTELARSADARVFGPGDPTAEDVDAFWREVDAIVVGMTSRVSVWRRLAARLSVRSLRRRRRSATAPEGVAR
ncbi:transglutaminase-like domain-containing protein [Microbacterium radiodurans]|uniref:Transglutaminase domain-containing protein n=1 Tax=Microbacterium radiodurans TaxID=661398 RepID=A0A5J5IX88_9MICO|nr:transglutaminase-like domain-containing protein [Microbacterium radiodurans]KAA9089425.1 transglutaminase domain-containing protein [Microbacterium radiodurans]